MLYWIPFLEWFRARWHVSADRLVIVSRGGVESWYAMPGARYVDIFSIVLPATFLERADRDERRHVSAFDRDLFDAVVNRCGLEHAAHLHPQLMYQDFLSNVTTGIYMRTDKPPFNDVRVRRAISHAIDRQAIIEAVFLRGEPTPAIGRGLSEWSPRIDQLGPGAQYYRHDPKEARRLLAEAGFPNGFARRWCSTASREKTRRRSPSRRAVLKARSRCASRRGWNACRGSSADWGSPSDWPP